MKRAIDVLCPRAGGRYPRLTPTGDAEADSYVAWTPPDDTEMGSTWTRSLPLALQQCVDEEGEAEMSQQPIVGRAARGRGYGRVGEGQGERRVAEIPSDVHALAFGSVLSIIYQYQPKVVSYIRLHTPYLRIGSYTDVLKQSTRCRINDRIRILRS